MKQEHRLVAELYRFIAPYIDTTKDIYVSLDGQAADTAVVAGRFKDAAIPDLWFSLVGAASPTRIEAKIIEDNGGALLMQSRLSAWRTAGAGAYKPQFWVASNRSFNKFYFWTHGEFLPSLDNSKAQSNTLTLRPPESRREFNHISELALHVLRKA
jgi:hypothetical protein